jgi:hypothetical protein
MASNDPNPDTANNKPENRYTKNVCIVLQSVKASAADSATDSILCHRLQMMLALMLQRPSRSF